MLWMPGIASAQYTSYFGESHTTWKLSNTFVTPETGSIDSLGYTGDTLVAGHTYKRYTLWSYVVPYDFEPGSVWYQGDEYFDEGMRVLLRESSDSLFMAIYFDDGFPAEPEQVVCAMGLEQGDTFQGMPVIATSTDAEGRKVIDIDMGFFTQRFVEGVGPLVFFQNNDWSAMVCQFKDDELNYLTTNETLEPFCQGNPLSTTHGAMSKASARAYPNPCPGTLHLELPDVGYRAYTLYDALGKAVGEGSIHGRLRYTVAMDHLPKGMYYLKLLHPEGAEVLKVVKD